MPLNTPGVYIEEVPAAVPNIRRTETSVTVFVGRTLRGPVDANVESPTSIYSVGDFERRFGGLDSHPMTQSVIDFFRNGGAHAVIVRLYKSNGGRDRAIVSVPNLPLVAASPGAWGNRLRVRVDASSSEAVAQEWGLAVADLFDLRICDLGTGVQEHFPNLTIKDSPRRVDRVLQASSSLVSVSNALALPAHDVPPPHPSVSEQKPVWTSDGFSTGVAAVGEAVDSEALDDAAYLGEANAGTGLHALAKLDQFNLLCIPPDQPGGDTSMTVYSAALRHCVERRAFLIVDPPRAWTSAEVAIRELEADATRFGRNGVAAQNAALYFPRVRPIDPIGQGGVATQVPCGLVAGVMARTDRERGVWKAPAGLDTTLLGILGLAVPLTDADSGRLNPLGVNCLRTFPQAGDVIWGARTLRGADHAADEYKYVPVRRLALMIEESLCRGLQWVAFEPNAEPLWAQLRLLVGTFMHDLFREGAFQGVMPREAYFVHCDADTTGPDDVAQCVVNLVVGFAPLKPAEFIYLTLALTAGPADP